MPLRAFLEGQDFVFTPKISNIAELAEFKHKLVHIVLITALKLVLEN